MSAPLTTQRSVIITSWASNPLPNHNWTAVRDGWSGYDDEPAPPIGYGGTELEAITDLLEKEQP